MLRATASCALTSLLPTPATSAPGPGTRPGSVAQPVRNNSIRPLLQIELIFGFTSSGIVGSRRCKRCNTHSTSTRSTAPDFRPRVGHVMQAEVRGRGEGRRGGLRASHLPDLLDDRQAD